MANYKDTEGSRGLFLTVNLENQVLPGTFEWTMSRFIDTRVDFTGFDKRYNNDETGATAIQPQIMLGIALYGYSLGIYSSRKLYRLCQSHMIMKALAEDEEPFHTTIARFIVKNREEIKIIISVVAWTASTLRTAYSRRAKVYSPVKVRYSVAFRRKKRRLQYCSAV
jgi:hypothetical protein